MELMMSWFSRSLRSRTGSSKFKRFHWLDVVKHRPKWRAKSIGSSSTDELMDPQIISVSNQMQRGGKYYKEYDKLCYYLMEMWRRPASIGRGLQSCLNCWIYMGESAHKSNLEFSSSPVQNLGASHIKIDAHITYDIQLQGCRVSSTLCINLHYE
jgi:hypothetical protein